MPSLREICQRPPVVILDAASALVQVGVLHADGTGRWETSTAESGVALFENLARLGVPPREVQAWVFCDGPGSVLGIRTVAMALRTWNLRQPQPVFAYTSLAVVAHALGRADLGVIADARRDTWHHYQIGRGLARVPTAQLVGPLIMPAGFRHWSQLPVNVDSSPYLLAELLPRVLDADLLLPVSEPDAFLHEEPSYVTWTPQVHRAPPR